MYTGNISAVRHRIIAFILTGKLSILLYIHTIMFYKFYKTRVHHQDLYVILHLCRYRCPVIKFIIYLPTYIHTYLAIYIPRYLPIYIPT